MTYLSYSIYFVLSSAIIFWVGQMCYGHGKTYILNYFPDHIDFGNRLNLMLKIAYYLLNIGLTVISLYSIKLIDNPADMIVEISERIGFILLVIGVLHFNNILVIFLIRNHFKS